MPLGGRRRRISKIKTRTRLMKRPEGSASTTIDRPDEFSPQLFLMRISELGELLSRLYDRRVGLGRSLSRLLTELIERDGQTQTELAHRLDVHKVSVGIWVTELEALGLVERREHPSDGRAKCIHTTPLLHSKRYIGENAFSEIHQKATAGIDPDDYAAMLRCLEQMKANLAAADNEEARIRTTTSEASATEEAAAEDPAAEESFEVIPRRATSR